MIGIFKLAISDNKFNEIADPVTFPCSIFQSQNFNGCEVWSNSFSYDSSKDEKV